MPSGLTFNSLPDISDPRESVRRASQLQFLIGANLLITLVGAGSAVAFVLPRSPAGVTILGIYFVVLGAFRVLGKRGWLLTACFGYCAFFWFSLALLTFVSGGVSSPVTPFFFPGMLIAAVLLGSGWACVYGAISASTLLAFGVFEAYGGQFPMLVSISLATRWTLFAIAMACAIPPVHVAISSMAASLRRAQSELAERMAAENRLRQSESGYRDIFDSIQDAFYRVDETGHLTLANRAFAEMLGYDSVDECLGKPMATTFYFDPADRQKSLNAIRRHGLVSNYEVTLKRKDGTPIQVAGNCSLKFDDRGHSCGVEGILRNITRQKQAHEAITRSEAKFGALFKYAPYSIGITRLPDGMILDVNPTFEKRTGYRRDEVVGKTALELGLWIEPKEGRKALAEVHSGQTILAREAHFRRRDGSLSTSLISFCPFDLLGERLVLFTSEDITEYKKTQEALRDKETMERLASVYSSDMQYSMKVDANGRVTFERISDSCSRLTGYSLPDLYRNETWGRIVHPHDLPAVKNQHQQHLIGKRTGPFEVRLQVKGGGVVWSRWHVEPIWNEDRSRVVRLLGIAQDITRRKQAELAMEEERVRFEGIVNSAFDGIIAIGTNLEVLVFNPAAERIFGRKSRVVLGDPVIQLFPERYRPTCSGTLELFSKAVGTDSGTARLEIPTGLRASGEEFPIEAFLSRVELHDGPMVTITCRDSSEQIRAEEARRRLEAQLRQAQKMEAIGTLAGGIAHDFNNILAAVMGYTEAAQLELVGNEAVRDSLDQVLSAAHRAKDLVQQILAFSRQRKHEPTAIMLQPVIKEA
ncbi:MAG TPA: PAS domain S-box protein, partial [Candidatus Limnocylindria bacterium]|nr:PAS domain S-box protein [Candidatus Limnocylindria bacterium]